MTLDSLKAYGANIAEGLNRCANDESFYLEIVGMVLEDKSFDRLRQAMASGSARDAFAAAHALKGMVGNAALTPLYGPICELTELLRGREAVPDGCDRLAEEILALRDQALLL